jgi:Domain of unknown function (DUF5916)/Carbohydrate family 9 binding domain-like
MNLHFTRPLLLLFAFTLKCALTQAQDRAALQIRFDLQATLATQPIQVDGRLDESVWQSANVAQDFWLKWPIAGQPATTRTEVRIAYDATHLYVGAMCFDSTPNYIIQSLKRDADYWSSDGLAILLDPANSAQNGYFFGLTSEGVQTEGLLTPTNDDVDFNWDNVWYGETQHHANGWTLEVAIPLYILRYDANNTKWGINFIRSDASKGQWSTWTEIPLNFDGIDLGWTGRLNFPSPPGKAAGNYAIVPYRSIGVQQDAQAGTPTEVISGAGLDARIGVGSAMNLDVTVNPDFSQIEIDEQVVNLTRFSIFLPEKRTFFLENADVFNRFGIPPIRPFFSRRIGLDNDGGAVPILGGLRLTGNLTPDTRVGVLSMQTRATDAQAAQNFGAVSVTQRVKGRSTIGGYLTNRQAFDKTTPRAQDFGRNAGIEGTYISPNGQWTTWLTYHHAFQPKSTPREQNQGSGWVNTGLFHSSERVTLLVDLLRMPSNYQTDVGFETRLRNYDAALDSTLIIPYQWMFVEGTIRFLPKNQETSRLNLTTLEFQNFLVLNFDGTLNEDQVTAGYNWFLKNTSSYNTSLNYSVVNLPVSFKFDNESNEVCPPIPAGHYEAVSGTINWESDGRKRFNWEVEVTAGQFYNGTQLLSAVDLRYRAQPWGNFRIRAEYNRLDFPAPYCSTVLFNITPRVEIFFNRNLNWTTFVQYNTQADNFNVNSRLQWRFRPMSDLFLVYTDNYAVQFWGPKSRAFVAKVNYWW